MQFINSVVRSSRGTLKVFSTPLSLCTTSKRRVRVQALYLTLATSRLPILNGGYGNRVHWPGCKIGSLLPGHVFQRLPCSTKKLWGPLSVDGLVMQMLRAGFATPDTVQMPRQKLESG